MTWTKPFGAGPTSFFSLFKRERIIVPGFARSIFQKAIVLELVRTLFFGQRIKNGELASPPFFEASAN
jgi:hypothetical protein